MVRSCYLPGIGVVVVVKSAKGNEDVCLGWFSTIGVGKLVWMT